VLLLDGHGSRFELPFLKYVIDKNYEWIVCIGVIYPYEIVILVNYAWSQSFARPTSNKHDIAERGWFLLNRALLLNDTLSTTMTEKEKETECESTTVFIPSSYITTVVPPHTSPVDCSTTAADIPRVTSPPPLQSSTITPSYNPDYFVMPELPPPESFNFLGGLAA